MLSRVWRYQKSATAVLPNAFRYRALHVLYIYWPDACETFAEKENRLYHCSSRVCHVSRMMYRICGQYTLTLTLLCCSRARAWRVILCCFARFSGVRGSFKTQTCQSGRGALIFSPARSVAAAAAAVSYRTSTMSRQIGRDTFVQFTCHRTYRRRRWCYF